MCDNPHSCLVCEHPRTSGQSFSSRQEFSDESTPKEPQQSRIKQPHHAKRHGLCGPCLLDFAQNPDTLQGVTLSSPSLHRSVVDKNTSTARREHFVLPCVAYLYLTKSGVRCGGEYSLGRLCEALSGAGKQLESDPKNFGAMIEDDAATAGAGGGGGRDPHAATAGAGGGRDPHAATAGGGGGRDRYDLS